MRRFWPALIALGLVWYLAQHVQLGAAVSGEQAARLREPATDAASRSPQRTFGESDSGRQIRGSGQVTRVLADDNDGSRHQRFILRLASGQTVLIAHNIDLAPRIESLAVGDTVEFNGEYVANPQGGVLHWTHRDPQRRHVDGWLRHRGREYR